MLTTQKLRKKETQAEKIVRLKKLSREAKASGCVRCKSYDEFAKLVGLRD